MVSIARGVSVSSGGGIHLSSDTSINGDDDVCILSSRSAEEFDYFKPLHTWHAVLLQLILAVGVELTAILLYFLWPEGYDSCDPFFILIYVHSVFWIFVLIIHNFLRKKHHIVRLRGYLDFHKEISVSGKIVFYLVSGTNTLLLVIITVFCQNYKNLRYECENGAYLKPYDYLLGIISIENVFLIPYCFSYMAKVRRHNQDRPIPDFRKTDWAPHTFSESSRIVGEMGFRNPNEGLVESLEMQADIIRCLRDRNDALCEQIILLEESMRPLGNI